MTIPYHIEIRPKERKIVFLDDKHNYQLAEYPMYLAESDNVDDPLIPVSVLLQIETMDMSEDDFILTGVYTIDIAPQI